MAELSTGAKVGIVLGAASVIGVGAYFLLRKPTNSGANVLANQRPPSTIPPNYSTLRQQNPQMDTASIMKLLSQLAKGSKSKSGGSSGGGSTGGGGGATTGGTSKSNRQSNPYAGYKAYPDYTGYKDPYSGYGSTGYGNTGYGYNTSYGYSGGGYSGGGYYAGGGYSSGYYAGGGYSGGGYYAGGGYSGGSYYA